MQLQTDNYISVNKDTYDNLASEFESKIKTRKGKQLRIINKFIKFLNKFIPSNKKILEIGPAAGYTTKLLCDKHYHVDAIEFSPKLAQICKRVAPKANVINKEFLSYNFGKKKFSGLLAIAFIHLFPQKDTSRVLSKIKSLLVPGGIAYISTTLHQKSTEGFDIKRNFEIQNIRFRRRFTKQDLDFEIKKAGFKILDVKIVKDDEEKDKKWIDYILQNF